MIKKILISIALLPITSYAIENTNVFQGFHIEKTKNKSFISSAYKETTEEDGYINYLMKLKSVAPAEIKNNTNSDKYDTHLKGNISDIKLSIPFSNPSAIKNNEIIGYAPIGSYKNGWTGIRIFFSKNELGECSFSFERFLGIKALENKISYAVNRKPTLKNIKGNYSTGFLYTLTWNKDNKINVDESKLECVNKNMTPTIMDKMVALGNQIEKLS